VSAETPRLLTARAVGEMLAVSTRQVYRLAASGDLPFHKLGDATIRFSIDDVRELLDATRRSA
jgi:excisionase family DNA binding protein